MKIGLILNDNLDELIKDKKHDGDYDFLDYVSKELGSYKNVKSVDEVHDVDMAFLLYYPFNSGLCKELLEHEDSLPFINKPSGILKTSEKTFELDNFAEYSPSTMLLGKYGIDDIVKYADQFDSLVIKPVDGTGGNGIEFLDKPFHEDDYNKLEKISQDAPGRYLLQEFVPNDGATRILCYNGEVLGSVKRRSDSDRIHNIVRGAKVVEYNPTQREIQIAENVAEKLKSIGVYFIGIDVVNDKLLEVNTAMPGCLGMINNYESAYKKVASQTKEIIKSYS